jgi:simple sugar transport system ATP-binding protein
VVVGRPPSIAGSPRGTVTATLAAQLRGIGKSFFGVPANEAIDLDLFHGDVHALLGENGAGKSTLCSILAGLYRPDAGEVVVEGASREFHSPRDALAVGIGMVYQDFRLVGPFTVAENLALGHPHATFRLSRKRLEEEAASLSERFGIHVDPAAPVWTLSVGEQQRVEILKLLHRGVQILILDEPTAVLTPQEADALFRTIRAMRDEGKSVVFVSHKLREILAVADRVTVLRAGRRVGHLLRAEADAETLARLMMGRDVERAPRTARQAPGATVLALRDLMVRGDRGNIAVGGVSLEVRRGETVGIAGVAGNGQRELAEAIAGLRRAERGTVMLGEHDVTHASPLARIERGISLIPEDRMEMAMAAGLPLEQNLILKTFRHPPFSRGPFLSSRQIRLRAEELTKQFDIRGARAGMPVSLLSGGNLQRAILARELAERPTVLVAATPTRGLDVAAMNDVWSILMKQREAGSAILVLSEDLEELKLLADRILVLYGGLIVGEVSAEGFDIDEVGLMMAGHARDAPPPA